MTHTENHCYGIYSGDFQKDFQSGYSVSRPPDTLLPKRLHSCTFSYQMRDATENSYSGQFQGEKVPNLVFEQK